MSKYTLHFDGSCGPVNPGGTAAYGYNLEMLGADGMEHVAEGSGIIGSGPGMTNNLAEFWALAEGLSAFLEFADGGFGTLLEVLGDSNLVIQVMQKKWKAGAAAGYFDAYLKTREILRRVQQTGTRVTFAWIPREENTCCDDLSKLHKAA